MLRQLKSAAHSRWVERAPHRLWLLGRADALFSFFEAGCRNPLGGYFELDDAGRPMAPGADGGLPPSRNLHITARLVHAFGSASLMGRPGAANIVEHGMDFLWNGHRDASHGGSGCAGRTSPPRPAGKAARRRGARSPARPGR